MADFRIKDLVRTVTNPNASEYIETDHATDGSGKLDLGAFVGSRAAARAPRGGIECLRDTNFNAQAPLGTAGAVAADPMTLEIGFECPSSSYGFTRTLAMLTSSAGLGFVSGYFSLALEPSSTAFTILRGDSSTDYRAISVANFITLFAGRNITAHVIRNGAGDPLVYVEAVAQTTTAAVTGGTAPAWNSALTSTYLRLGNRASFEVWDRTIHHAALWNIALSQAEIAALIVSGGIVPYKYKDASQVAITSGSLVVGKAYRITAAGGTFTAVGAADNNVGTVFVATGTTPTWSTGAVVRAGIIVDYEPDSDGIGWQLHDRTANKRDLLLPSSGGFAWAKPLRTGLARGTSDGTTAAQQLGGGTLIPANTQLLRIRARSLSGTPSITLGNVSGGSQFVASVALSTAWKDLTIALTGGINTTDAPLWMTASAANVVEVQIAYEQLG